MSLNTSCAISGTGFLIDKSIIRENNGWKHHLLTEDIEFTIDYTTHGGKIGFSDKAILYDEQPETFKQSWTQRMRWSKGFYQIIVKYWPALIKGILKRNFSCFDMAMTVCPAIFVTLMSLGCIILEGLFSLFVVNSIVPIIHMLGQLIIYLALCYITLFLMGLITLITEWDYIDCKPSRIIKYSFTFPIFMFTYIPISIAALFKKVTWAPIKHNVTKSVSQINNV